MTYKELAAYLATLNSEQLDQDVTVFVEGTGEYYPLASDFPVLVSDGTDDVLDNDHVYIKI